MAHCTKGLMCLILIFIFTEFVAKKIHDWAIFSLLTLSSFAQFFAEACEIYGRNSSLVFAKFYGNPFTNVLISKQNVKPDSYFGTEE